jgi:predicted RNA-binding protein with PIN domain
MAHYLLVDGYNIIHADNDLTRFAEDSLETARIKLCDLLCEFRALSTYRIIVVFDAHLVSGGVGSVNKFRNITVVFTREAETADHYIERAAYTLARTKTDKITVATSDVVEQLIIMGSGAARISADALLAEIETAKMQMRARDVMRRPVKNNPFEGLLDKETAAVLEKMRVGERKNKKKGALI